MVRSALLSQPHAVVMEHASVRAYDVLKRLSQVPHPLPTPPMSRHEAGSPTTSFPAAPCPPPPSIQAPAAEQGGADLSEVWAVYRLPLLLQDLPAVAVAAMGLRFDPPYAVPATATTRPHALFRRLSLSDPFPYGSRCTETVLDILALVTIARLGQVRTHPPSSSPSHMLSAACARCRSA